MRALYPYQRRALEKLLRYTDGGALLFEPGLGKTLTSIRGAQVLRIGKAVVVCPVSAVGVWRDELLREGLIPIVPTGTRKQKAAQIREEGMGWVILNYEALLDPAVERAIKAWGYELLIVDEAHKIKTPSAKRSRAVHRLSADRRTWILTGTPVTRNLLDLYSIYKAIDPYIWDGESWTQFKRKHAVFGGFENREVVGIRDPEALLKAIQPYSVAATKDDVLSLPKRRDQLVPVYLTGAEWQDYRTLAQTGVLGEWVTDNPLTKALRLQQLVGRFKLPYTVERIQELLDAGKKVVVFYRFRAEGAAIRAALGTGRIYEVHGGTPEYKRNSYVNAFQSLEGPAVFLGQIQATSTAITLTAAHEVVYHSLTFSYEDAVQSKDRVYRIGQEHPVRYQYMTVVGPEGGKLIDGLLLQALERKQDFASMVMSAPGILEVDHEHLSDSKAS